jgi:hypothetical protein
VLRRTLIRAALSGGILGLAIPSTPAQQKMSQADAEYQDGPNNGLTCVADRYDARYSAKYSSAVITRLTMPSSYACRQKTSITFRFFSNP